MDFNNNNNIKIANGDVFVLARTNPVHFASKRDTRSRLFGIEPHSIMASQFPTGTNEAAASLNYQSSDSTFKDQLMSSLGKVNQSQQEYEKLVKKAITDPDSVETHDISIASAKAKMMLDVTKNVVDRVIQAYQSIVNLR